MLSAPTKTFRVRAAIVLAALYALCCLAPAAAFAFSDNPDVAHCLIEGHVGIHKHGAKLHIHADGSTHQHHGDAATHQHHDDGTAPPHASDGDKAAVATCCGLFSVVAIPGELNFSLGLYSLASVVVPVPGAALSGRGPERINRPPIA
jgi:hypothetical protein